MALGQGVHLQAELAGAGDGQEGAGLVEDEAVRVVIDKENAVAAGKVHQLFEDILPGRGSRGHVGIIGPHDLYAREVQLPEGLEVRVPAVGLHQVVGDDPGLAQAGGRCVGGIAGIGHQHPVAGIQKGQRQQKDALFGAHQGLNLGGGVQVHAVPRAVPVGHGFAKLRKAGVSLVAVVAGVAGAAAEGLHGLVRRGSVRRPDPQVDDRVQATGGPVGIERGDFPVLEGEIVFFHR